MSSPQSPDGGQQGQQPQGSDEQLAGSFANTNAGGDSTDELSSPTADQGGDQGSGDDSSTQMVRPVSGQQSQQGQQGSVQEATAMVPPSAQPAPQPMYEQPGRSGQLGPAGTQPGQGGTSSGDSTAMVPPSAQPGPQPMYGQPAAEIGRA